MSDNQLPSIACLVLVGPIFFGNLLYPCVEPRLTISPTTTIAYHHPRLTLSPFSWVGSRPNPKWTESQSIVCPLLTIICWCSEYENGTNQVRSASAQNCIERNQKYMLSWINEISLFRSWTSLPTINLQICSDHWNDLYHITTRIVCIFTECS